MGCCVSRGAEVEEDIRPRLKDLLHEFIKLNGHEDASGFVPMSTLVLLYTSFIKLYYPDLEELVSISLIQTCIRELCWERGYYTSVGYNQTMDFCVIGLSIDKFEMPKELPANLERRKKNV